MEIQIDEKDVEDLKPCKKCNKKISNTQIGLIIFSFYVIFSAVYGTYKIIENLMGLF
jgi:hypothetical protein